MNKHCFRLIFSKTLMDKKKKGNKVGPEPEVATPRPSTPDAPEVVRPRPSTPDAPEVVRPRPSTPDVPDVVSPRPSTPDVPEVVSPRPSTADTTDGKVVPAKPTNEVVQVKPATEKDDNARHMTQATLGTELKNVLAKLNSPDRTDQAALKANPLVVNIRGADGKVVAHTVSDINSLKALHGQQVITGERAEGVNYHNLTGTSSKLYVKLTQHPGGGYTYTLTHTPPKPL